MSQSFIRVKAGAYRTTDVSGQVFQLVEQYKQTPPSDDWDGMLDKS